MRLANAGSKTEERREHCCSPTSILDCAWMCNSALWRIL